MKQGWEIKKLGEVCDFQNGFAFQSKSYKESGLPILRITNIQNDEIDSKELVYFDTKDYKVNLDRFKVYQGDLLIAMSGATTGKLGINNSETVFYLNQRVGKFIPKKFLNKAFLYYFLTTKVEESLRIAAGAAQPNLSTEQINNFEIPLPPLPEQQRIVAILDEAFAAIAKAKTNAEQNLKNAKELFESYLQDVFENGNWVEKKLSDLSDTGAGGTPLKSHKDYYQGGNVPWLRSGEVDKKDIVACELFITEKGLKNSSARLFPKDTVLIAMYGATAGQVGILRFECSTNQAVCGILPNKNIIPEFLYYKFMAGKQALVDQAVGGAQPNISQIKIKNTLVPFITFKDQQNIVQKLDALSTETKKLEAIYKQKINDLEELKKSILQKAFSGELQTAKALV